MPKLQFIDHPQPAQRALYDEAVEGIIDRNKKLNGLKSIVKFGNITTPGISDLDLLFVFESGQICQANGLENLPEQHKNLFTHGIMAISEDHYTDNEYYTLWSEHHLVWGDPLLEIKKIRNKEEENQLKIQTAVEFLIANYIDIKIQKEYKIINLRSLLQHMKGILYDLEYLNDANSAIHPHLFELKEIIRNWFISIPTEKKLTDWFFSFEKIFEQYVQNTLAKHSLYLPTGEIFQIRKNMTLQHSSTVGFRRKGLLLPQPIRFGGRTYIKFQHRLNNFSFSCPITHKASTIVQDRFKFLVKMKDYNRQYLPNFMTITSSIIAKLI